MRAGDIPKRGAWRFDLLEIASWMTAGYLLFLYYNLVAHAASLRGFDLGPHLKTALDDLIPYQPAWVLPYLLAYVLPPCVALCILARTGWDLPQFRRLMLAFYALLVFHYAFYLLVPSSIAGLQPTGEALGRGLLPELARYCHGIASPWNAWPSFHVAAGWFMYRVLARHHGPAGRIFLAWFVSMAVATVAIKVHWLLDGLAAVPVAEAFYRLVLLGLERRQACRWVWPSQGLRAAVHWGAVLLLLALLPILKRAIGYSGSILPLPRLSF